MKADTAISLVSLAVGIASAVWTYRTMRGGAGNAPDAASQYHAKNNPFGFSQQPDGTWVRITPNGQTVYYT